MIDDAELSRLQRAYRESLSRSVPTSADAPVDQVWEAVQGRLSPSQTREILDRAVASPATAEAWLIARRILDDAPEETPAVTRARSHDVVWRAAAALFVVAVGLGLWKYLRAPESPVYRGEVSTIESGLPDEASLPRGRAELRWRGVPGVAEYNLRVLREDLTVVLVAEGLETESYTIPVERLEGIRDGERLQWQVEWIRPDGTRVLSRTFHMRIIGPRNGPGQEGITP